MTRPMGVTVIAVVHFLAAVLLVVLGVGMIAGPTYVLSLINQDSSTAAGSGSAGLAAISVMGIGCILSALIEALLGRGLWKLRNWARIAVIVLCAWSGISIVRGFFARDLVQESTLHLSLTVFGLFTNAVIAWYLLQPEVDTAFRPRPS
jgi:hypothetical protein